ncbi:MAG: hypothetical protein ABI540_02615 [Spartobacteria bacterium]
MRNLALATAGALSVQLAKQPVVRPLTRLVEGRRLGLLKQAGLPAWIEIPLAIALLDYTLYLWHVLTHRVPFLWRFHQAHHVDSTWMLRPPCVFTLASSCSRWRGARCKL